MSQPVIKSMFCQICNSVQSLLLFIHSLPVLYKCEVLL